MFHCEVVFLLMVISPCHASRAAFDRPRLDISLSVQRRQDASIVTSDPRQYSALRIPKRGLGGIEVHGSLD